MRDGPRLASGASPSTPRKGERMAHRLTGALAALALLFAGLVGQAAADTNAGKNSATTAAQDYVVLYKQGASPAQGRAAVKAAGGTVGSENTQGGVAPARSTSSSFADRLARQSAIDGVARNLVI